MLRLALLIVLMIFLARAFWRLVDGIVAGLQGGGASSSGVTRRSVQMERDPVCGTFVVPERSVMVSDGAARLYFCSTECRDRYRARTA